MSVSIRKLIENEVVRVESGEPYAFMTAYARGMIHGLTLTQALSYPEADAYTARLDAADAALTKQLFQRFSA